VASGLIVIAIALAHTRSASGQTWIGGGTANNPTSGNWSTNGAWAGGGAVIGTAGSNTQLTFMAGGAKYTSTNDINAAGEVPFNLNSMTFSTGGGTTNVTVAGMTLLFAPTGGANPTPATITANTTAAVTIQNPIRVATNQFLFLQGNNTGSVCTFTGGIADGPGGNGGVNMVSGSYTIDASSTYTGDTVVHAGVLRFGFVGDAAAITLGTKATPTGDVNILGGTLNIVSGGNAQFANVIYASSLDVSNGGTLLLGGTGSLAGLAKYGGILDTTGSAQAAPNVAVSKGGLIKGVGNINTKAKAAPIGNGKIRGVKINGKLQPGDGAGTLSISGGVEFGPASVFAPVINGNVPAMNDPNGDPTTEYSMLNVTDSGTQRDFDPNYAADGFTSPGPVLAPEIDYQPSAGDTLFLIVNNGVDGNASDEFYSGDGYSPGDFYDSNGNDLTQGSDVWLPLFDNPSDLAEFQVDYNADYSTGSLAGGNDFALIAVPEPTAIGLLAFGAIMLRRRTR
jgi:autotransporter-associated beta strand protein